LKHPWVFLYSTDRVLMSW